MSRAESRQKQLDNRDKELRELIAEMRDGAQVGICRDLCPEKERYRRMVQQVSYFYFQRNA